MTPAIRVTGLTRRYPSGTGVGPLSFEVPRGVITGLVGPNGVGKTTTIRMLLGLITPDAGEVSVLDADSWQQLPRVLPRVGALVEGPALFPTLSGRDNLLMLSRLSGWPDDTVDEAIEQVGLTERARDRVRDYSLGMRGRLALAGALLGEPELLILDEPANGLDPQGTVDLRRLLSRIAASGPTVVVSSHVLAEVEQVCDHLVVLSDEGVAYNGSRHDLTDRLRGSLVVAAADAAQTEALLKLLRSHSYAVAPASDGTITILEAPESDSALDGGRVNQLAIDAGIVLSRLEPRRQSLEEIFFELTGSPTDTLGRAS